MTEHTRHINRFDLPESLQQLIECVGMPAALRLLEWRGGAYLCVPKKVHADHPLLELLGAEPFAQLVDWYAGETIMLPKNDAYIRQVKHCLIKKLRFEGLPIDQIALRTGYTMRRVFQILGDSDAFPQTADLFE